MSKMALYDITALFGHLISDEHQNFMRLRHRINNTSTSLSPGEGSERLTPAYIQNTENNKYILQLIV